MEKTEVDKRSNDDEAPQKDNEGDETEQAEIDGESVNMPPPAQSLVNNPIKVSKVFTEGKSKYFSASNANSLETNPLGSVAKVAKLNKVHCSVPVNDVKCSLTNNVYVDVEIKKRVRGEIKSKIYSQPRDKKSCQL